ncbi:transporter substrate-binding domain-containing protein [Halarchaeum sp. CBA1220]|uniref:transporter substrate-binding domain-containing protein n=1 Tax=Halarchaeum sp. CBA1220 TaxID=1853682 RepID=UPI000F3AA789|nr:transporter substrate-binding domain-containing protein [Halarchaeum sp. CBA1220]QLC32963.1 transporter substrate-binding domain-containing protein [Halarchaeum sp. CBA1220]
MDRRSYLKALGASGAALTLAGCTSNGGGDGSTTTGSTTTGSTTSGTQQTQIVAGTAPGFQPFEMIQDGELVGFDIDLLEAVVEQADGYTLQGWEQYEFGSLIQALTTDKIDTIAAGMTITEKRKESIGFTNPYWDANQALLVREGSSFQPQSLKDLAGHKVGAQSGTTGEGLIQDLIDEGTLAESNYNAYPKYPLAVSDLENGNIDAVVIDTPVAETFVDSRDVVVSATVDTGEQYGFGVRQNDGDLESALNGGLEAVRDNGTYADLTEKWFASGGTTTTSE